MPSGSRTMTRRTRPGFFTWYQRTSRTWTSRWVGVPRCPLVPRKEDRPGSPRNSPRPRRHRTRRLLRYLRPDQQRRRGCVPLRRALADRGLLPRRQTRPRWARSTVLETTRTRTRRQPLTVAPRTDLVLVHRHPPNRPDLDPKTLVPRQEDSQLP